MNDQLKDALKQLTDIIDSETEFIPLITSDEEETMNNTSYPDILPILPLRNNVLFPGVVIPITVGRDKSIKLIQAANKGDKIVGVVSQKDQEDESPEFDDLHKIGTVAQIIRLLKMPDGSSTAIIPQLYIFCLNILAKSTAITRFILFTSRAHGACSRDEPHPKFLPAAIISPGLTLLANSTSASSMQWDASSGLEVVFRYLAGNISSVLTSSPNLCTFPLYAIYITSSGCVIFPTIALAAATAGFDR